MMRTFGLAMILIGCVGIGVSLIDWREVVQAPAGDETAAIEAEETGAENSGAEAPEDAGGVISAALENEPSEQPAAKNGVAERDPANVRVFEPNGQPEDGTKTLWADISAGSESVSEDSGHASFLLTLSEPAERSVVIIFSTIDVSANDKEDYQGQRGTVTFEPGVVSAEIRTPLVDDDIKEEDEEFAIVLNGAPGIVNFKSRRITTTIKDND